MGAYWDQVYQGNGEVETVAARFLSRYREFLPRHPQFEVADITARDLVQAFGANAPTAAGPDSWAPAELSALPL
eukprot:13981138-Alexandrium_andersonii.AAC.1